MRYVTMIPPTDPVKKIAYVKGLIARAEEKIRRHQAGAKPGTQRMIHTLINDIRAYRRDLHKMLVRQRGLANQKRQQQTQMEKADRAAPADRRGELPAKQDQEARKPGSQQGVVAGQ